MKTMKVTLTDDEGHRGRLKVTKINKCSYHMPYLVLLNMGFFRPFTN